METPESKEAMKVIADAASEAVKVVSSAASEAMKVLKAEQGNNSNDHDLLVRLSTQMEGIQNDIKSLSARDDQYVMKEDFAFWRNLLVAGMLMTIFMSVIGRVLSN